MFFEFWAKGGECWKVVFVNEKEKLRLKKHLLRKTALFGCGKSFLKTPGVSGIHEIAHELVTVNRRGRLFDLLGGERKAKGEQE